MDTTEKANVPELRFASAGDDDGIQFATTTREPLRLRSAGAFPAGNSGPLPESIDELVSMMNSIVGAANAAGRGPTRAESARYAALESKLEEAQVAAGIFQRNAAMNRTVTTPITGHTSTRQDDTLERAFTSYLRTGKENADLVELRAQSEGTGSEGGYLVPDGFRNKLVDRMKAFGGIGNVVETVTSDSGQNLPWPSADDTANTGEVVDEGGSFSSGADITLGSNSLGAYSYVAGGGSSTPLRVSLELLQDSAFDVEAFVSRKLGERLGRIMGPHLVTGTGVKQPLGIVTGLTGVEMSATGPTYDDLIGFIHTVDPAYRESGARWAFNDASWATIKKLKDSNGDPLWRAANATMGTSAEGDSGAMLLGYPVTIDQAFGDIVTSNGADNNWGVFGNLAEGYVRRIVRQIQVLVNPYSRMGNRQVEYTAWARQDGTQQNTHAYTALAGYTA